MSRRRRWMLLTLPFVVVAIVAFVLFGPRWGKVDVRLVYLGPTKVASSFHTNASRGTIHTNYRDQTLFLITNAGTRTVRIFQNLSFIEQSSKRLASVPVFSRALAQTNLGAGEWVQVEASYHPYVPGWRAHIAYTPRPAAHRLSTYVWGSTNAFMHKVGRKIVNPPRYDSAFSDWITNQLRQSATKGLPPPSPEPLPRDR